MEIKSQMGGIRASFYWPHGPGEDSPPLQRLYSRLIVFEFIDV
jgi:hypothetical protein